MLFFVAILAIVLLGVAVTLVLRGALTPATQETIEQISAYGYAGNAGTYVEEERHSLRDRFDSAAGWLGERLGSHFSALREREIRAKLVSAGLYTTTPARIYGYQFILGFAGAVLFFWLATIADANPLLLVAGTILCAAAGWVLPLAAVNYAIRMRRERIERELPDLIDLLVVSIEAGLSFNQGLRLAANRLDGPLAQELRLTLQEQNMGLTLTESLVHLQDRADTPGMRAFVRAMTQGESLGVSTGQIMRNLAEEMRKRRKAAAEERAQKAPVKMLFPLLFLIFPAIFIVLLLPPMISITDVLG
jgi:tight adherence protein C